MSESLFFLALDAGTGGGKALVCDSEGRTLGYAYRPWDFSAPSDVPGASEFDAEALWLTLAEAAREALARSETAPASIRGIAVSSFRDGSVLLDGADRPLLCFSNCDGRAVVQGARLAEEYGDLIHRQAGRRPFGLDLAEHLVWTREERPEIFARIKYAMSVGDWVTSRLCGERVAEPTNASSTLLFDVHRRLWSPEITAALELGPEILPPLQQPGSIAGALRAGAAEQLGLRTGTAVAVGGADSALACLGCGALDSGAVVAAAGTTIPVMMVESAAPFDASRRLWSGAHPLPDRWLLESNGGPAGVAYAWVLKTLCADADYAALEAEAEAALPGTCTAFLGSAIADFSHLSFPRPLAIVIPAVLGFGPTVKRGAIARAALENIAFAVWANAEQLIQVSSHGGSPFYLCGGLTRSKLFAQVIAEVAARPVEVSVEPEAAGLGAAICAAVGAGCYPDLAAAAVPMTRTQIVEPQPASESRYRGLYQKWLQMVPQIAALK